MLVQLTASFLFSLPMFWSNPDSGTSATPNPESNSEPAASTNEPEGHAVQGEAPPSVGADMPTVDKPSEAPEAPDFVETEERHDAGDVDEPSTDPDNIQLPPEFEKSSDKPVGEEPKPEAPRRPDPAGVVLEVEDKAPSAALPGEPLGDPMSANPEREDYQPSFENNVTVRTAVERSVPQRLTYKGERTPPKRTAAFLFAYRHYSINDQLQRRQNWHLVSLELAPLRRYARLSLATEVGWEGGEAAQGGDRADLMILEKVGVGVQYPHWLTPYAELQAGFGAARVEVFERNDLAWVYSLGADVGMQWAVSKRVFLLAAIGWQRPTFIVNNTARYYDRAAFKVGFGL